MASYTKWDILKAWIPNSDGSAAPYPHRCIYLGDSPTRAGHIVVLGITSDLSKRHPIYSVDMPSSPEGHTLTGLTKQSIAQALWTKHIPESTVRDWVGETPSEQKLLLAELLARRSPARS